MESSPDTYKTICIHQPDFAPWLGFFQRLVSCDALVILDHVQFVRRGWHNRDRFVIAGTERWLSVPVISKGKYHQPINDTLINNQEDWRHKHLSSLRSSYGNAEYFSVYFQDLERIYFENHIRLQDLNMSLIRWGLKMMELSPQILFSSSMNMAGRRDDMLVDICVQTGAEHYVSGQGAKAYLKPQLFEERGIEVVWQNWKQPAYARTDNHTGHGLSFVDALMHAGPSIKDLIR